MKETRFIVVMGKLLHMSYNGDMYLPNIMNEFGERKWIIYNVFIKQHFCTIQSKYLAHNFPSYQINAHLTIIDFGVISLHKKLIQNTFHHWF